MASRLRKMAWFLRPKGKLSFVLGLPPNSRLLDVGCGNNSAVRLKSVRPDIRYTGLDIADYNQDDISKSLMDQYIIASPEDFDEVIGRMKGQFDVVISSHNIEHCLRPFKVISAMCSALRIGGRLYLSFPSEATINFPSREGCLNFSDDSTHVFLPHWTTIIAALHGNGMTIDKSARRHRPWAFFLAGILAEPLSALNGRVDKYGAVWALWGFESVVWASRRKVPSLAAANRSRESLPQPAG